MNISNRAHAGRRGAGAQPTPAALLCSAHGRLAVVNLRWNARLAGQRRVAASPVDDVPLTDASGTLPWQDNLLRFSASGTAPRVQAPPGARPIVICPGFGNCTQVGGPSAHCHTGVVALAAPTLLLCWRCDAQRRQSPFLAQYCMRQGWVRSCLCASLSIGSNVTSSIAAVSSATQTNATSPSRHRRTTPRRLATPTPP